MLKWNEGWRLPVTPLDRAASEALVRSYAQRAHKVPGVLGVWAAVRGEALLIYTLLRGEREAERQLHEVELDVRDSWPDLPVSFEVYGDEESLKYRIQGVDPILFAA